MLDPANTDLNRRFKAELEYLRKSASDFAKDHPSIAESLQLSSGHSTDPHIEMLLQSFAFLTGRLHLRLDAESPQISNQLLYNLYPHLVSPMPPMAVVQAKVIPDGANFSNGYQLKRGRLINAVGEIDHDKSSICTASLCFDTDLWPLKIEKINIEPTNHHEFLKGKDEIKSVLKIRVAATGADPISDFRLDCLRFYIDGDQQFTSMMYPLITHHVKGVAVIKDQQGEPILLPSGRAIGQGFCDTQSASVYTDGTHQGYRLLQEYFSFPQKFLFVDIEGLDGVDTDRYFDLLLLLDRPVDKELSFNSKQTLRLNCVPIVNLYKKTTDPIRVDKTKAEYKLVPDVSNYKYCEVHSVEQVWAIDAKGRSRKVAPYFGMDTHIFDSRHNEFWNLRREESPFQSLPGSEVYLSFFDSDSSAVAPAEDSIYAKTVCCNRRLMENIGIGFVFDLDGGGPVTGLELISKPTRHQLPALQGEMPWRLISQLTLNHLSLSSDPQALNTLKKILSLHAGKHNLINQSQIESLCDMKVRKVVDRIGNDAWRGFCDGIEISLTLDEGSYHGTSSYLFGEVLNRFFGMYASVNSFTKLILIKKNDNGIMKQWNPQAGEQVLI